MSKKRARRLVSRRRAIVVEMQRIQIKIDPYNRTKANQERGLL